MFNLVIFGPPGSGKGTQSVRIAEKYRWSHLSTGEIFRREIRSQTPLGLRVKSIIEKGALVPDEILVDVLKAGMKSAASDQGFLFDGYPRTLRQAADLDKVLGDAGESVNLVLSLEAGEEELVKRLLNRARLEGRADDTEEVIRNRMSVYYDQTQPLVEYYKTRGCFRPVDGLGSVDEIFVRICQVIDRQMS
jgi:adenylate kinase